MEMRGPRKGGGSSRRENGGGLNGRGGNEVPAGEDKLFSVLTFKILRGTLRNLNCFQDIMFNFIPNGDY